MSHVVPEVYGAVRQDESTVGVEMPVVRPSGLILSWGKVCLLLVAVVAADALMMHAVGYMQRDALRVQQDSFHTELGKERAALQAQLRLQQDAFQAELGKERASLQAQLRAQQDAFQADLGKEPAAPQAQPQAQQGALQAHGGPDLYHSITNVQHRGGLAELCNKLGLTENAVEIGVYHGGFSHHNLLKWKGKHYYMIDAWTFRKNDTASGSISGDKNEPDKASHDKDYQIAMDAVREWLPPRSDRAIVKRMYSEAAVLTFPDGFFDFMYIDAGHEYVNVLRDLRLWWPKLRKGGMVAGDDFADFWDKFPSRKNHAGRNWGVKSAVTQFSKDVGSPFFLTFADSNHGSTEVSPRGEAEFVETHPTMNNLAAPPREFAIRAHDFYPAWYMFK